MPMKALDRALNVMSLLASDGQMGLSELARRLSIPKAAAFRILQTLQARGCVHFDPSTQTYGLGITLLHLADKVRSQESISEISYPYLVELANRSGETSSVGVLKTGCVLILKAARPEGRVILNADLGPTSPIHSSALGKVLLAYSPPDVLEQFFRTTRLERYTPNTITTQTELEADLVRTRQRGWALDEEETEECLVCIAAPVFSAHSLAAAVSISGPATRVRARQEQLTSQVCGTALAVSTRLGWHAQHCQRASVKP